MIEDAERDGRLKPGGTIIEGTSGNTGMGLAIAAVVKGYKCIFTTTDKQSKEKVDALRAFGAEVIVCPTNVDPDDPALVLLGVVAARDATSRTPGRRTSTTTCRTRRRTTNRRARRSGNRPTAASRTWSWASARAARSAASDATSRKRIRPSKLWGIDTYGSVFKKYKETGVFDKNEIYPYVTEGIGEDFLPQNVDFSLIDHFEKVTDKDAAIMTRRIAREEGIFAGNSAGAAMAGLLQLRDRFTKDDVVVVIFHDHGTRYLGKMFNDDWMRKKGYLDKTGLTARDLVASRRRRRCSRSTGTTPSRRAVQVMTEHDYSQTAGHRRRPLHRIGQRNAAVSGDREGPRGQRPADRDDHAAGVSVRRRLDGHRRAVAR